MALPLGLIKGFEGLHDGDRRTPLLEPERCPAGYWTLGWGAVVDESGREVTRATPAIDVAAAERLLIRDVGAARAAVFRLIAAPLRPAQIDALTSFTYNLGAGRLQASTLRARLNRGDAGGAADEFPRWVYGGTPVRRLPGLIARRDIERRLFLSAA